MRVCPLSIERLYEERQAERDVFMAREQEMRDRECPINGNSRVVTTKEQRGSMCRLASDHCQVLASLKSAEASRALRVAISLGV